LIPTGSISVSDASRCDAITAISAAIQPPSPARAVEKEQLESGARAQHPHGRAADVQLVGRRLSRR
jgi:hypothetical protein